MKTIFKFLVVFIFTQNMLYAHGGHKHKTEVLSQTKIVDIAHSEVNRLSRANKIARSWLKSPLLDAKKMIFGSKMEWVVSYKNTSIPSKKMQVLYIFVGMDGKVYGANYTGK